jgi:hypothetical protein
MARYIKASMVDAVKKERDGEAGYEVKGKLGTRWMDKESFEDAYSLLKTPAPKKKPAPKPPEKPTAPKTEAKKTAPVKK